MGRVSPSKQNRYGQKPVVPEIPEAQIPRGGRSAVRRAEREAAVKRSQTPYVPPAPTSPASERQGGRARVSGGIQIGVPKGAGISTQRPNRSSNTTTETPTQNAERPSQATGGKMYGALPASVNRNLGAYDSSVTLPGMTGKLPTDYKETEQTAGQTAETYRPGAGFGSEQRIDSRGNIQTGTNTSPKPMTMDDANKLLSGGYKIENPYSSNQLPTTASSPYAGKSNSQIYNPDTLHQHNSDVDYVSLSKDIYGDQSGVELATRNGGMKTDYQQMDVNPGQQAPEEKINWANRTMADNSDEKVRRRSAMLDGNVGIMQAMRNQEAIQGRVYAGGKHYQVNKNKGQEGENDFVEISASQARDRSWGNQTADEVFANHLGKAKETAVSTDIPDVPKDTPAMLPDAVPHNTSIDKSPFDTSDLLGGTQSPPNMESIIDDDKPYVGMQKYNPFR